MIKRTGIKSKHLRNIWKGMRRRCNNPRYKGYKNYGARGIKICEEWENNPALFEKWAFENGYKEDEVGYNCSINRIDNEKGYSPDNCRWVGSKEQSRNRRNTVRVECNGKRISNQDFAELYGITSRDFVKRKIAEGKTADEILQEWNCKTDKEHYMNIREAAEYYNTDRNTIHRWIVRGKLQAIQTKRACYILKGQNVDRFWRLSQEQQDEIYELYKQGISVKEMATMYDRSISAIQRAVQRRKKADEEKQSQ